MLRIASAAPHAHLAKGVVEANFVQFQTEECEGRHVSVMRGPELANLGQMTGAAARVARVQELYSQWHVAAKNVTGTPPSFGSVSPRLSVGGT